MVTVTDRRAEIVLHQEAINKRTQHSLDTTPVNSLKNAAMKFTKVEK
jgi:hypothetical protein